MSVRRLGTQFYQTISVVWNPEIIVSRSALQCHQ